VASLRRRPDGGLPVHRARERGSAFVYGNITVLGAVVAVGQDAVRSGSASVVVLATAAATFVAHVMAHVVSERIGPDVDPPHLRREAGASLRDALPIASSGVWPALLLLAGTLELLPTTTAWAAAAAVVGVRLALTGLVVERVSGRRPSSTALWGGVVLAALSAVVAVVKAVLTH